MSLIIIIHTILSRKQNKLMNITTILLIYFYINNFIEMDLKVEIIFKILIGITISNIWLYLWSFFFGYKFKFIKINKFIDLDTILTVLIEEIIWRGTIQRYLVILLKSNLIFLSIIISIVFTSILFVLIHPKLKTYIQFIEFILFSFLLSVTLVLSGDIGVGIGVHFYRNIFIKKYKCEDKYEKNYFKSISV